MENQRQTFENGVEQLGVGFFACSVNFASNMIKVRGEVVNSTLEHENIIGKGVEPMMVVSWGRWSRYHWRWHGGER